MRNFLALRSRRFVSVHWVPALALFSFVLLAGCDGVAGLSNDEDPSFSTEVTHETLSAEAPETESIDQGQYADIDSGVQLVIQNEQEFSTLWEQLHGNRDSAPAPPSVDFDQQTVIAVVMESQPTGGYSVSVDEALLNETGDEAQIRYTETAPGDDCGVTMAFTSPYVLATIDATVDDASFTSSSEVRSCSTAE
jgi:hypothetical protein